ncbi:MAG: tRNA (N6-isopentenyl adenosine(37)-C2)-methylthiotransferase MiaB, partial [Thermodesulfobacteriota bacterium]
QMNEDDTSRMLSFLSEIDYRRTTEPLRADLILINTCTIRDKAEQKVYSTLGRLKAIKRDRPGLVIGVSGCVAQQKGDSLLKRIPHLDMVVGTHNIHRLPLLLKEASSGRRVAATELSDTIDGEEYRRSKEAGVKTFVNIMRGCNNYCSYCIVPYVRGREVSRAAREIITDVRGLAAGGTKEVTLVGQNVNSYGGEDEISFPELLRRVAGVDGIERVRFVTSHPKDISEELIALFGEEPKLARSVHLPVQSGSDRVLERMRRGYTARDYLGKVLLLKKLYPGISITTDIIVGFPGETDEEFQATMEILGEVEFDGVFSFKYSPRPGTMAATFEDHVDEKIKVRRLDILQSTQKEISARKNAEMVGRLKAVLVEGVSKGSAEELTGRTECNRVVNFPADADIIGEMARVLITDAYANSLRGVSQERSLLCS